MKVLGMRLLVSRVDEDKKEGFEKVEVQDSFVYKGKIEQLGSAMTSAMYFTTSGIEKPDFAEGGIVLFAKYSPDTQEVEHDGKKYKIIRAEDVLAVL